MANQENRPHLRSWPEVIRIFLREPTFRDLLGAACLCLLVGTIFYHFVEGWSWFDSLYFCTITLTTIGYGDFVPTTEEARIFTIFYVLIGIGIIATFVTALASARLFAADDPGAASRANMTRVITRDPPPKPRKGRWVRRRSRVRRTSP